MAQGTVTYTAVYTAADAAEWTEMQTWASRNEAWLEINGYVVTLDAGQQTLTLTVTTPRSVQSGAWSDTLTDEGGS